MVKELSDGVTETQRIELNSNHALQLGIVPLNSTTQELLDDVSFQSSSYHPYFDCIFVQHFMFSSSHLVFYLRKSVVTELHVHFSCGIAQIPLLQVTCIH